MKIKWNEFHLYGDLMKKNELRVDNPQEVIADYIYKNGHGAAALDLCLKVLHDDGNTEYSQKEAAVVKALTETLSTPWAVALNEIIKEE